MADNPKPWTKPQLIVLTRGTSAESVLTHCKVKNPNTPAVTGPSPVNNQDRCDLDEAAGTCSVCQARAQSGS